MSQHNGTSRKPLTALAVRQLTKPGRYSDGNGLYLVVDPSGARRWLLRIVVQRRRRDIGLGSARLVPLTTARETAIEMRRIARDGGDPVTERRKRRALAPTFKDAATQVHAETVASWKNERQRVRIRGWGCSHVPAKYTPKETPHGTRSPATDSARPLLGRQWTLSRRRSLRRPPLAAADRRAAPPRARGHCAQPIVCGTC